MIHAKGLKSNTFIKIVLCRICTASLLAQARNRSVCMEGLGVLHTFSVAEFISSSQLTIHSAAASDQNYALRRIPSGKPSSRCVPDCRPNFTFSKEMTAGLVPWETAVKNSRTKVKETLLFVL